MKGDRIMLSILMDILKIYFIVSLATLIFGIICFVVCKKMHMIIVDGIKTWYDPTFRDGLGYILRTIVRSLIWPLVLIRILWVLLKYCRIHE